jgi:hypothetical protein
MHVRVRVRPFRCCTFYRKMSETRLDFSGTFYRMPSIAPVTAVIPQPSIAGRLEVVWPRPAGARRFSADRLNRGVIPRWRIRNYQQNDENKIVRTNVIL